MPDRVHWWAALLRTELVVSSLFAVAGGLARALANRAGFWPAVRGAAQALWVGLVAHHL